MNNREIKNWLCPIMTSSRDTEKSVSIDKKSNKKLLNASTKTNRSQSLDRLSEGTSDSKEERKERRNLISLVNSIVTFYVLISENTLVEYIHQKCKQLFSRLPRKMTKSIN